MIILAAIGFICLLSVSTSAFFLTRDQLYKNTDENISNSIKKYSQEISDMFENRKNELYIYADLPVVKTLDWDKIEPYLKEQHAKKKDFYDILFVADTSGDYNTVLKRNAGNLKDRAYWKPVMDGNSVVSEPVISKSTGNMVSVISVPIKDDKGTVIGMLAGNLKLDNFYDKIKDFKVQHEDSDCYVVNSKGLIIAHSNKDFIMKENISVKSDSMPQEVVNAAQKILTAEKGSTSYTFNGVKQHAFFSSIPGINGWKLVVKVPFEYTDGPANDVFKSLVGLTLLLILIISGIAFLIGSIIVKPLVDITSHMGKLSKGNLSESLPEKLINRNDELGVLSAGVSEMQSSIKDMIYGIVKESRHINAITDISKNNIIELTDQILAVSETTMQLSAGMEETAASTEEMTATSCQIESAIESIASKAQSGASMAYEINASASKVNKDIINAQNETESMYKESKSELDKAIEEVKCVDQINVLSEAILQITSQTNLLALNAAIEAARAGESGKGFAVVADEIRKLAEQSKDTVTQIQNVTKAITLSVNNLANHSEDILKFVEDKILKDYRILIGMSEQYSKDALYYNDMSTDLSATSQELIASVQTIVKAINEIAGSNNEAADGTQNISDKISVISDKASDTVKQTEEVKQSAETLDNLVGKFII